MKAIVDEDACTGCAACQDVCPEVFDMNEDEIAIVKVEPIPAEHEAAAEEAAESCPVEAITLES